MDFLDIFAEHEGYCESKSCAFGLIVCFHCHNMSSFILRNLKSTNFVMAAQLKNTVGMF